MFFGANFHVKGVKFLPNRDFMHFGFKLENFYIIADFIDKKFGLIILPERSGLNRD